MNKTEELRNESDEELNLKLNSLRYEIFNLRSERLDSKTQKTHLIREKRKEIARILTVKKQKELKRDNG